MSTELGGNNCELPLQVSLGCFVGLLYQDDKYIGLLFASSHLRRIC